MFLAQKRINEIIVYCILADVVLGYILKRFQGPETVAPLALLYLLNIVVLMAVYRFWKFPLFEWDESGFIVYGISPFKKHVGAWGKVEAVGFKTVYNKKGKPQDYLIIIFTSNKGMHTTGTVPMDLVGFRDPIKKDLQALIGRKKIRPLVEA